MVDKIRFFNMIEKANSIAIFGHVRPDGDCVGSCLGLYNYIADNYTGKTVKVYLEQIPTSFKFLRYSDTISNVNDHKHYELGISLDCGDTDRHGELGSIFKDADSKICIDHHKSNQGFGDYFYDDPDASSTAEIMTRFLDMDKVSKECAECLYLGIVHDTGVFKYSATTKDTMIAAGELMSKGINTQFIIDDTFYKVNYNQNRMTGWALEHANLYLDGQVIETCITKDIFEKYNTNKNDTEGIVDKIRVTDGVEVAIFIYQLQDGRFKFSLRSISKIDVSLIAVEFGGGGHIRAAGFEVYGDYKEYLQKILKMIEVQL